MGTLIYHFAWAMGIISHILNMLNASLLQDKFELPSSYCLRDLSVHTNRRWNKQALIYYIDKRLCIIFVFNVYGIGS